MAAATSVLVALLLPLPSTADPWFGVHGFFSSDADETDVAKFGVDYDFRHAAADDYLGISLEHAQFRPSGQRGVDSDRLYVRFADGGTRWRWAGRIGSDGHTVLGSFNVFNTDPFRQEYFVEREVVETPLGLQRELYSTFVGAALDIPFDDRTSLSTVLGAQDFDGRNTRLHYRGNLVYILSPDWGLSAQLRLRYFHDSVPGELDYFSPRWYAQAIPTLQVRRFVNGWRYAAAVGLGQQYTADAERRSARLLELSITSPIEGRDWFLKAAFTHTNTPIDSGLGYDYSHFLVSVGRSF